MSTKEFKPLNLDVTQQKAFIDFFNNLPEKPLSTVRIFSRNDYYTLHGEDANLASSFASSKIKEMGTDTILSYTCLNKSQFESFIRELLLVRQYRVEVFVKNGNDWSVHYKGSPGNLTQFEEILFENDSVNYNNSIMAVKIIKGRHLAIACANTTEVKFEVCEINDNECFSELEALIAQVSPRECIIPSHNDSSDYVPLKKMLDRNGILVASVKRSEFNSTDIIQDLNRLLLFHEDQQRNAQVMKETNLTESMCCLQALIKFLNLLGDEQNFNQYKLSLLDTQRFVRIDNAAMYSLNILPTTDKELKNSSLLGLLNNCSTSQGRRLLECWLKQPLKDFNLINERLEIVECFVKETEARSILSQDTLTRLGDLTILSKKLGGKKGTLQDCYRVYQTITAIERLNAVLRGVDNKFVNSALVDPIEDIMVDLRRFQEMVEQVLDFDLVDRGQFLVKNTFDDELQELSKKKNKIEEKLQKLLQKASSDLGLDDTKTIKLECNDQYAHFFRVSLKEEQVLRKQKTYTIIDVVKAGVRFTNPQLLELNKSYVTVMESYEEQQKSVVDQVLGVVVGYLDSLRTLNNLLATVDVLTSLAVAAVSAKIPYVRPKILPEGSGIIKLQRARHPCLEQLDDKPFIPNDVEFGVDNKNFFLITGPNMCGKSTYLRSISLCVLMAQIGSFVPCLSAEISIVDAVLSRIGADDCQLKGLSTFMLEMIETSSIITSATKNSLVVIDELGRGTSTYDGCGIAFAIAEHLATETKCFTLFATHFQEITRLAEKYDNVGNLHVTAVTTETTITPLFQVREGVCDKSYGVHCARSVGFPEDVIQCAIEHQKQLEHYDGMRLIDTFEPAIKRKIIQDGDKIIEDTLSHLKGIEFEGMTDDELRKTLNDIKEQQIFQKNNLFINGLLSN